MTTEYAQRAIYGPKHELSHLMHDTVHVIADGGQKTACGKELGEMWFVVRKQPVTCKKCAKTAK